MASYEEIRPLPKFGEWDVNDPASAEGFSGIFDRARNDKVAGCPSSGNARSMRRHDDKAWQSMSTVVPLYVATKMASIKRSSFFEPSADGYARADLQWIGYEPRCTPYLPHSLLWRVAQ